MAVRYRNKKSGKIVTFAQPIPRLEKSDRFDRVEQADSATAQKKKDTSTS